MSDRSSKELAFALEMVRIVKLMRPEDLSDSEEAILTLGGAIERLTRERDTAREALRISEQRVREHWPERDELRSILKVKDETIFALQADVVRHGDENRRLRAALTRLTVELECGRNITHYCSNCDCSLFDAAKIARAALEGKDG